jgi:signal transduction histidine kinase
MKHDVKSRITPKVTPALPFQRRKQLERDLEHITEEMYRRNKELADTNKTLSLLQTVESLALESHTSTEAVCAHITEAIVQTTSYTFVGLLTRSLHAKEELTLNGWSGVDWVGKDKTLSFSRPLHLKLSHQWFTQLETTKLVSLENISIDIIADFLGCPEEDIRKIQRHLELNTLYVMKLIARRRVVGLLVVGFRKTDAELTESDSVLLGRLSESIGLALDNKLLFEENRYVLRQLRESNTKLRDLDEAKDDFISMASHQLRTPLTSIKGYLSMVLEGDAGKTTKMQHEMLGQAFASSQRMVYLIADLLNISRLKTGKFLIEPSEVNLADVIEQELSQLEKAASGRSLKLTYDKPSNFPHLMLDETKTRQVIMNFVDNAIYYTPANGHIAVKLIDKPTSVELRVEDDGIGVPKAEQAHLFTKFYRAGNATKARPDGTGLGLFMAKKVIVAQGGAIIFDSKENQGSTFGFVFSKSKLASQAAPHKVAQKT